MSYAREVRPPVVVVVGGGSPLLQKRASELHLYTHELRSGSRAETVFLGQADMHGEDVLWKELLIFFMNTKETSPYLKFLRSIEPLAFDPGLVGDYLDCFQSNSARAFVIDELESLYEDMEDKSERLNVMGAVGASNIYLPDDDDEATEDEDFEPLPE